jgi:pimeloyl-ACP methyl ester carboxylesterase
MGRHAAATPIRTALDLDRVPRRTLESHHGVTLAYWVVGEGEKTLLLANGLGGRLYAWEPLIRSLPHGYRFITWDYRGLFESTSPKQRRHLSIPDHAEDARAILDAEGIDRAVLCGWSMGVQVSLELATLHPERVAGLVLLNGTYGHALQSGFQPLFPLPFVGRWGHRALEALAERPALWRSIGALYKRTMTPVLALFWLVSGTPMARARPMLERYRADLFEGDHFVNYLQLFQELDAHSTYHHLRHVTAPALIISGAFDLLTPAYQSRQIAARLPRAEALHLLRASHFVLIERPEVVLPRIEQFLDERVRF